MHFFDSLKHTIKDMVKRAMLYAIIAMEVHCWMLIEDLEKAVLYFSFCIPGWKISWCSTIDDRCSMAQTG